MKFPTEECVDHFQWKCVRGGVGSYLLLAIATTSTHNIAEVFTALKSYHYWKIPNIAEECIAIMPCVKSKNEHKRFRFFLSIRIQLHAASISCEIMIFLASKAAAHGGNSVMLHAAKRINTLRRSCSWTDASITPIFKYFMLLSPAAIFDDYYMDDVSALNTGQKKPESPCGPADECHRVDVCSTNTNTAWTFSSAAEQ